MAVTDDTEEVVTDQETVPVANNEEMISHILGKLIRGRDLQVELSFSAAHAMTKYEV